MLTKPCKNTENPINPTIIMKNSGISTSFNKTIIEMSKPTIAEKIFFDNLKFIIPPN